MLYLHSHKNILWGILFVFIFSSCFTGVESTKIITEKDVKKETPKYLNEKIDILDTLKSVPIRQWKQGKLFYVTEDQIRLIFLPSQNYNLDTISLRGKLLKYEGVAETNILGNKPTLNIYFADKDGDKLIYDTRRTKDDLYNAKNGFVPPFMIDLDLIEAAKEAHLNKELYIKTPLWYDDNENLIAGKKFIPVTIIDILPGNKIYPIKFKFETKDKKIGYVYISLANGSVLNRNFNNIFSEFDVHQNYPTISDSIWTKIINAEITNYMTKEECKLSLGAPKSIDRIPTYSGLKEIWTYDNGTYLIFEDGILTKYRK